MIEILCSVLVNDVFFKSISADSFEKANEAEKVVCGINRSVKIIFIDEAQKIKHISALKKITDGKFTYRPMRQRGSVTKEVKARIVLVSNPFLDFTNDSGTRRRVVYRYFDRKFIPANENPDFVTTFPQNPALSPNSIAQLNEADLSQFFNWFVIGAQRYIQHVQAFTRCPHPAGYMLGCDIPTVKEFLSNTYVTMTGETVTALDMFHTYQEQNGVYAHLNFESFVKEAKGLWKYNRKTNSFVDITTKVAFGKIREDTQAQISTLTDCLTKANCTDASGDGNANLCSDVEGLRLQLDYCHIFLRSNGQDLFPQSSPCATTSEDSTSEN